MELTREEWKDWAAVMCKPLSPMELISGIFGISPEQARAAAESAKIQSAMCRKYGNDNL